MVQDFAKQRTRTPLAEPEPKPPVSSQGLLLTGLLTGIAVGLFISLLVYLSGALPPAPGQSNTIAGNNERAMTSDPIVDIDADANSDLSAEQEREAARLQLEFYQELPNYEVVVDATPINVPRQSATSASAPATTTPAASTQTANDQSSEISSAPSSEPAPQTTPTTTAMFMLQAGAFRQQTAASAQANRLLAIGLDARVRQEALPGRTLFLVQAGPYNTRDEMMQAERLLRNNSIESMRITLSQP
jgi:cell division protein FtsN